jgi:succinate dehydrogenase / fumarate reductase flavoprotein subunit
MMEKIGIYRNEKAMTEAVDKIIALREEYDTLSIGDTNKAFNTELLELIELKNLLDLSLITAESARNRKESRGAHSRKDFPDRNDDEWLKHTMVFMKEDRVEIDYTSVDLSRWKPKPRVY